MSTNIRISVCIVLIIPLGFGLKYYSGPFHVWCNNYGAAVVYEVFWCLAAFLFFPGRRNIPYIAAGVFAATCALEFMQLWHPPLLDAVRSTFIGVTLIGNGFDPLDFPHYVLGCGIGWAAMSSRYFSGLTQVSPIAESNKVTK